MKAPRGCVLAVYQNPACGYSQSHVKMSVRRHVPRGRRVSGRNRIDGLRVKYLEWIETSGGQAHVSLVFTSG
jgi:hypothetical protein